MLQSSYMLIYQEWKCRIFTFIYNRDESKSQYSKVFFCESMNRLMLNQTYQMIHCIAIK